MREGWFAVGKKRRERTQTWLPGHCAPALTLLQQMVSVGPGHSPGCRVPPMAEQAAAFWDASVVSKQKPVKPEPHGVQLPTHTYNT